MKVSEIFEDEPRQWGLRGNPYLWREMKDRLKETEMPSTPEDLKKLLENTYQEATGHPISEEGEFFIERFEHGGISGGYINQEFWERNGIPMLVERHSKS